MSAFCAAAPSWPGGMRIEIRARAHPGVGEDDRIACEILLVLLEEGYEAGRQPLLLALDEHDDADRRLAAPRADRRGMDRDAALVVGCATAVEPSALLDGLEGLGVPELARSRGLDVMVCVEENGRCAARRGDPPDRGGPTVAV